MFLFRGLNRPVPQPWTRTATVVRLAEKRKMEPVREGMRLGEGVREEGEESGGVSSVWSWVCSERAGVWVCVVMSDRWRRWRCHRCRSDMRITKFCGKPSNS